MSTDNKNKDAVPPPSPSSSMVSMKRALSYLNLGEPVDAASQKKRTGMFHSLIMGFCLLVLLMTILATQEPYRYIRSNLAIQKGAHIASLQEDPDLNIDAIWEWFDKLAKEIGGTTYKEIEMNCGYNTYDTQTVTVDGIPYTMLYPGKLEAACAQDNMGFISGQDDPLYLIGSHQILAAGAFTKRANTNFPIQGSVSSTELTLEINSDKSEALNPLKDNKVVEVCSVIINTTSTGPDDSVHGAPVGDTLAPSTVPGPAPVGDTLAPSTVPGVPPGPSRRRVQQPEELPEGTTMCIHRDGFAVENVPYTPGSTMNWEGQIVEQGGDSYYTFDRDKMASFFADDIKSFTSYPPCYITDEIDGQVRPGIPTYTGTALELRVELADCKNTWVSKGRDFRTECLDQQNTGSAATAQQSYLAGLVGVDSVPLFYELVFGCESLINWDVLDIDDAFVEATRPIESYLEYDQSYGAFFPTGSESDWVESAIIGTKTLKMHGFLDKQTTDATVYLLTRNLNEDALFYTLIKVSFEFRVNGYSNVKYHPIFSPMIQYEYGTDGYGWRNRQMYVWEIMFLIMFSLFFLREVYQLIFSRCVPFVKRLVCPAAPVSPIIYEEEEVERKSTPTRNVSVKPLDRPVGSPEEEEEEEEKKKAGVTFVDSTTTTDDKKDDVSDIGVNRGSEHDDSSLDIEEGMSKASLDPPLERTPAQRPNTAGMMDLNRDGKDDFEQLGNFMHDLNGNGIDDTDELLELVDEYLPDAAGMLDILDWLTIGIVGVSIYFRLDYINKTADLHEFFKELAEEGNYHEEMTNLIIRFAEIDDNLTVMNVLVMFLVFFGILQFFRYLSFDKRLGIVTATIKESMSSLLPVLVIFLVLVFAYSVLGTVMYGAHLNSWSNVGKSGSQLFLLILREFGSYFDIMQINPGLSAIYFWTYIIMALFLLFNMVLAVIFTVYDEKNSEIMAFEAAEKERLQLAKETKKDR